MIMSCISCSAIYDYVYRINNITDSTIDVQLETVMAIVDIKIQPGSTVTIYTTDHGIEAPGGPNRTPVQQDLLNLIITTNDTILLKREPLYDPDWEYNCGEYTYTVRPEDF